MEKLWAGRFAKALDETADDFNSSISFDSKLYRQDITGSMAHAAMLGARNIISGEDAEKIIAALQGILEDLDAGKLQIDIFKRIPVAAGLAGGSGNGAAVLHGLNVLWKLNLNLERLCDLGAKLGSDVPFCVMGQAKCNFCLPRAIRRDPLACTCARATGTGAQVLPETPIKKSLVIAKPPMGVSTKEVYKGIDQCRIQRRPDNDALAEALKRGSFPEIYGNCINVLENYTLNAYPQVGRLKEIMLKNRRAELVLMSGSGPTVFSVFGNISEAKKECESLRKQGYEAYWTKTIK